MKGNGVLNVIKHQHTLSVVAGQYEILAYSGSTV